MARRDLFFDSQAVSKMAIDIVDFPIKNGDFPIKNGDFPIKNGDFPIKNGDFPIQTMKAIENGHRNSGFTIIYSGFTMKIRAKWHCTLI